MMTSDSTAQNDPSNPASTVGKTKKNSGFNRPLTPKQLHYARCRANGTNMSDSYRESYSASRMSKKTINEAASRLDGDNKVTARVDYLIAQKDKALIRSEVGLRAKVLKQLESFMDSKKVQDTSRIRAAELLGKSIGLFKDVIEDGTNVHRTPEELRELLHSKLLALTSKDSVN